MPKKQTSLERIYDMLNVPDWGEMFPDAICKKCHLIGCEERCAALTVIDGLAVHFSANGSRIEAQIFAKRLRDTLKSVPDRR